MDSSTIPVDDFIRRFNIPAGADAGSFDLQNATVVAVLFICQRIYNNHHNGRMTMQLDWKGQKVVFDVGSAHGFTKIM